VKKVRSVSLVVFLVLAVLPMPAHAEQGFLPRPKTATLSSESVLLENPNKAIYQCRKGSSSTATFTNDKEVDIDLDFKECTFGTFGSIRSLGDESGTILVVRTAIVCLLNEAKLTYGIAIPFGPSGLQLEIPAIGGKYLVKGLLIGELAPTKGKAKNYSIKFSGSNGKQTLTKCGGKEESLVLEANSGGKTEGLSESFTATLAFTAEVELMDS
jgi:hypothetical protein